MAALGHHLRGKVLWGAAESFGDSPTRESLGQSIVNDLEVAVFIDEDIFQLEISVHDTLRVEVADCQDNLQRIEPDHWLRQTLLHLEDLVELASFDKRHDEVETLRGLEQVVHTTQEGMITSEENVLLQLGILDLLVIEQDILTDCLDGVELIIINWQLSQENFTKSATTEK